MSLKTMELKYTLGRGQQERDGDKEGRKHNGLWWWTGWFGGKCITMVLSAA